MESDFENYIVGSGPPTPAGRPVGGPPGWPPGAKNGPYTPRNCAPGCLTDTQGKKQSQEKTREELFREDVAPRCSYVYDFNEFTIRANTLPVLKRWVFPRLNIIVH